MNERAPAHVGSKSRALLCGLAASLMIASPGQPIFAQSAPQIESGNSAITRQISMGVGKSVIVDLPEDAAEIFVGNPKIANAVVRSPRKLYVIGMENGATTVFALDAQGRQIAALEITIGRDIGELQEILKAALPTSDITTRTINDTIILNGNVDSPEDAQRAEDIAEGFVKDLSLGGNVQGTVVNSLIVRGRDQVMLKVSVAEIRRDIAKQLGLTSSTWGPFTQYNPFGINGTIATSGSNQTSGITLSNPSGTVSATLQAFERYGVSHILAEPTVSAVSGQSAKFTVGGEVPIPAAPVCSTNGTVTNCSPGGATYEPYGITLNFAPIVLSEGRILLHLATEVTELDYQTSAVIQGVPVPGLRTRKNETTVEIPSGGSIASAGLLESTTQQVINGFPGLMDLPILGTLFRSRDYQKEETELLIVITPYLVRATTAAALPKPDDGFADSSDPQAILLGRINRLYASPNNPEAIKSFKGRIGFILD
ncbi:MAG TPA: type II and III secretion system protein family protein [Methylovirgula sp.]|nr:type II and III secretion system protein family protein [Methylovirgula sp.]